MRNEIRGFIKRQYNNIRIFKAYSPLTLLKELFLSPKDMLSSSGCSSNLINIALFVTMRCNARCAMCNIASVLNSGMPDIPLAKIEKLLDDVKRYRPSVILFGGEPFLRGDIVDIVKAVKKRYLTVGMFTNGTLIDEKTADALRGAGLDYIAFSLQGSKEIHDKVLAVSGSYEKMISAIRFFTAKSDRHTKVIIHSTICEHNVADLESIARLGKELDADLVRFGHPTFYSAEEETRCTSSLKALFGDAGVKATSYTYDISGKEDLYLKSINVLRKKFGRSISFTPELSEEELRGWYSQRFKSGRKCLFAWRGVFIYPNGDVYPCESISYKMGNVFESDFSAVWNGPRYKEFRRCLNKGLLPACARCCKL